MSAPTFDNAFTDRLPGDPQQGVAPREVREAMYSLVSPTPVASPRLRAHTTDLAAQLGLGPDSLGSERFARVFAGNELLDGMQPWAANYGGHQFGHWAGQLGDGRAISLGELIDAQGERWELQLKGAGRTPYSRGADGRAVLRSSLREFVCSEAMHHLGVPTTRALSLVTTGEQVVRDMFYDGHPAPEPGAIVCRVAPSFIRFGSFELPASRGELDLVRRLLAFTVERDFPGHQVEDEGGRAAWFAEVCRRTATMVAHWMRVGFVHGVMNTDNMSILGQTIDYGPYGWMDEFDPDFTPNTTDATHRRYRFGSQPDVAWWNLSRLAGALSPLFDHADALQAGLDAYVEQFHADQTRMLGAKLGIADAGKADTTMCQALFALMQRSGADMTLCFRLLARIDPQRPSVSVLEPAFYDPLKAEPVRPEFDRWLRQLCARWEEQGVPPQLRVLGMDRTNPRVVFRNYLAQEAIDKASDGDDGLLLELIEALRRPYEEPADGADRFAQRRPEWARHRAGCSMLSCSS